MTPSLTHKRTRKTNAPLLSRDVEKEERDREKEKRWREIEGNLGKREA